MAVQALPLRSMSFLRNTLSNFSPEFYLLLQARQALRPSLCPRLFREPRGCLTVTAVPAFLGSDLFKSVYGVLDCVYRIVNVLLCCVRVCKHGLGGVKSLGELFIAFGGVEGGVDFGYAFDKLAKLVCVRRW